jgi:hypothetical protein
MISGLLSTLNEEAQEDVLSEEFDMMHRGSSENISISDSIDNLDKSGDALLPKSIRGEVI